MPDGQVLEFTNVTKRFNEVTAVSDLSARVEPGAVTAFLGPNGAGKTTTLRILLGQVRATSGSATIGGTSYAELRQPLRTIGSVLEDTAYRTRRTASRQLTIAAKANGIPLSRVDQVLSEVGLDGEGDSRIGGFSLGMRQRLSVAHALLGDPGALVFDEPANGLDPEGIRWMRLLMRRLADEGRTVLVSSHVLSEVEQVADNVLVLSKGQLVLSSGIETLADPSAGSVVVDAADRAALTTALSTAGFDVEVLRSGLTVRGGDARTVGAVAAAAGIALSTLVQRGPTLEDVFIDLVRGGKLEARASAAASQLALPADSPFTAAAAAAVVPSAIGAPADAAEEDAAVAAFTSETEVAIADENAMIAEVAAVSASLAETSASDPVTASGIAAGTEDPAETNDADHTVPTDVDEDGADESPAAETPSFDEILFGTAAQAPNADSPFPALDDAPVHDVSQIFADRSDDGQDAAPRDDETPRDDATPQPDGIDHADHEHSPVVEDGVASDAVEGSDADRTTEETGSAEAEAAAGIEIFADLGESAPEQQSDSSDDAGDAAHAEVADPRSAAVSSMLAAAARAYYEDEPKDYPLGEQPAEESSTSDDSSTRVIDSVPSNDSTDESPANEGEHYEHQHEGEHHEHQGEHHEHQDGEHQHHEHHDGEHQHG